MDRSAVHLATGRPATDTVARPAGAGRTGHSSGPVSPPLVGEGRPESDAEFLAKQAAKEVPGAPRSTFARFQVDSETHQVSVQIVDSRSQEVIRTIPNEDLRRMAQRFRATQGFLLDSAV